MNPAPILSIHGLRTFFFSRGKQAFIRSVDGVSFEVHQGETLGIVGESGSGKSVTAMSVMGLISGEPGVISGSIRLQTSQRSYELLDGLDHHVKCHRRNGRIMDVAKDTRGWGKRMDRNMRGIRGKQISMIFQNPKMAMNPFSPIGRQIKESVLLNTAITSGRQARERALYWLEQVRIDSPRLRYHNNPYGLSGGMCQRAMIAMALSSEPSLLIADEPTTGLDATIQSRIVGLMADLQHTLGITTMLISHDIHVIKELSDHVAVMYGGTVLEYGPAGAVLSGSDSAKHPYTAALLNSIPNETHIQQKSYLQAIKGDVLDTINLPEGCRFYGRCDRVTDRIRNRCQCEEPLLGEIDNGHRVRCWRFLD